MDPREAQKLATQRIRLFATETASIQEELDALYEKLAKGADVPGSKVKEIADRLRRARSRLAATLGEDAA